MHPDTVLRLVTAAPEPEVLGVDEFAPAEDQVYGMVLVDMHTGEMADLPPDWEAATLETHPDAAIRDRVGNYAEGARVGRPRDPGCWSLAPVAHPGRIRLEDDGCPPRPACSTRSPSASTWPRSGRWRPRRCGCCCPG